MARLGHSSTRGAMIYQHATQDRDQAIAKALGNLAVTLRGPVRTGTVKQLNERPHHDVWPVCGPFSELGRSRHLAWTMRQAADLRGTLGAGDGNRTRITSLEGYACLSRDLCPARSPACASVPE
jgi:hypothetical protein